MYVPRTFVQDDVAILHDFIRAHSFAVLTTQGRAGLLASHLPLQFEPALGPSGTLFGHMARANPQWCDVSGEVLVVFHGPHAYVSPTWYETPGTVPTWNYLAVHVYGAFHLVEDRPAVLDILRRAVRAYEPAEPESAWSFADADPRLEPLLQSIVGFRIEIGRLEGKWKLSQNHPPERRERVRRALAADPREDARAIAALMGEAGADAEP